jgi:hypothetical protein
MPKTYSWAYRIPELLNHLDHLGSGYCPRGFIEELFKVKRTAATTIMRAAGSLSWHGSDLTVKSSNVKGLLEMANKAMDIAEGKGCKEDEAE